MDIFQFFTLFATDKKYRKYKIICRYQQYFAVEEIIKTINTFDTNGRRNGGVIWHTQGSGKSLTMVMVAKYILMEMSKCNPRVVIVTDRKELDKQRQSLPVCSREWSYYSEQQLGIPTAGYDNARSG